MDLCVRIVAMANTKKKRGAPLKICQECGESCHARVAVCGCGYVFYQKSNKNKPIENWQELGPGDTIKSVKGHGPYWLNPETKEKTYMGSYGKFSVRDIGKDYIIVCKKIGNTRVNSGTSVLYMGDRVKSSLCDNLYNCPHKLVRV